MVVVFHTPSRSKLDDVLDIDTVSKTLL